MKGIILAGGLGTRLYPLTYATNKHLLPIYDRPMVFYPIQTLVQAGVTEVIIVTGGPHAGHFVGVLRNGKELGLKHLEYAYQEHEGGIAQALGLCEDFADGGDVAVILGDNTTDADISEAVQTFSGGATVFLRQVPDPERFGVPVLTRETPVASSPSRRNRPNPRASMPSLASISMILASLITSARQYPRRAANSRSPM